MGVNCVFLVTLLIITLDKWITAEPLLNFKEEPTPDTVTFKQEYDFIIIGAGAGNCKANISE